MVAGISAAILGQRIKQTRIRRGMTQQDLAADDYSKSYISAIEQGKTRPSLNALQRIAARLEMPASLLLDPTAEGFAPYDPESMPRRIRHGRRSRGGAPGEPPQAELKLAFAEIGIYTGQASQALQAFSELISSVEAQEGKDGKGITRPYDISQAARLYYLAALAATRAGDAASAVQYAAKGMQYTSRVNDRALAERLRNLEGTGYYMMDQPLRALESHRACLEATRANVIRDPNFRLQVYYNLAADYWALHDNERARDTYKEAMGALEELNGVDRQARIFQGVAESFSGMFDYGMARTYAHRSLGIYEALDNMQMVARMENRYGDILVEMGDLKGAEGYLARSLELAQSLNNEVDKAVALTNLARFMLKQGNLDEAETHAQRAVQIGRSGSGKGVTRGRHLPVENVRVLSKALAVAGEVATQRNDTAKADQLFTEAIRLLESNESAGGSSGDIYRRYAQVLSARGDHEQAAKYYERAYSALTTRSR